MAKNLIIYYSRKGENYWNGSIKNIAKGNTEIEKIDPVIDCSANDLLDLRVGAFVYSARSNAEHADLFFAVR